MKGKFKMLKRHIRVGKVYAVKVLEHVVPAKVVKSHESFTNGRSKTTWTCENLFIGQLISVRSCQQFRHEWRGPTATHVKLAKHTWNRKTFGVLGWNSECTLFQILEGAAYSVLMNFELSPIDDLADCWRKRFQTTEEAMQYAETM
jgi:hypothetical protein